jgi:hypothetical protein
MRPRIARNAAAAWNSRKLGDASASAESPEEIFLQEWRRQLFALAIEDLRMECDGGGKRTEWEIFEAYDLAEGDRPTYSVLARRHGLTEASVTNYLAWTRRRLRALVTDRLRGVTSGERELREEMRRLWN